MPIDPCKVNGKSGFKVRNANKCFTGPGARSKAQAQQAAIKASQKERKERKK